MMLNMMDVVHDRTAATQLRLQRVARANSGPRPDGRERRGASVFGWAAGLKLFGGGRYMVVGSTTIDGALLEAAKAIRLTGPTGRPADVAWPTRLGDEWLPSDQGPAATGRSGDVGDRRGPAVPTRLADLGTEPGSRRAADRGSPREAIRAASAVHPCPVAERHVRGGHPVRHPAPQPTLVLAATIDGMRIPTLPRHIADRRPAGRRLRCDVALGAPHAARLPAGPFGPRLLLGRGDRRRARAGVRPAGPVDRVADARPRAHPDPAEHDVLRGRGRRDRAPIPRAARPAGGRRRPRRDRDHPAHAAA